MLWSILGAGALAVLLPVGAAAQAHEHGAAPQDSSQAAMMQMHEHMQAMQHEMMQMHGQQGGQGMKGMSAAGRHQGMVSTLLLGSSADLALTDAQRSQIQEILEQARSVALEVLTVEQRQKLGDAPVVPPMCPVAQPSGSPGGG